MSENQSIDSHSGSPFTNLMDDMDGGDFHTNGGPYVSYPHHARYLTFWNFIHKKSSPADYNFWSVDIRKPTPYAEPYFIGLQPTNSVSMVSEGLNEMQGIEVEPKSLFEAQLALRLNTTATENIAEGTEQLITIYPNPFSTSFQIQASIFKSIRIRLHVHRRGKRSGN